MAILFRLFSLSLLFPSSFPLCLFFLLCDPGTLDGGLGYVLAVPEKVYRRLSMLQLKLVNGVAHYAGLNPKAFRFVSLSTVRTCVRCICTCKCIWQCSLVYFELDYVQAVI